MQQPSVLVADDDEGTRETYRKFFALEGWRVEIVPDGVKAIEAATAGEFDIVITDLVMPGTLGDTIVKMLRESNPEQAIIVVTGSANVQDVIDSVRSGASDILLKPLDYDLLRESIHRIVNSSKQTFQSDEKLLLQSVIEDSTSYSMLASSFVTAKFFAPIIDRLFRASKIDNSLRLKLHLAVQEALANSLDHGVLGLVSSWKEEFDANGHDTFTKTKEARLTNPAYTNQLIEISTFYTRSRLEITVRDPGPGFLLREGAPEDLERRSIRLYGRGLAIITGTMDEVRHERNGAQITMVKYLV